MEESSSSSRFRVAEANRRNAEEERSVNRAASSDRRHSTPLPKKGSLVYEAWLKGAGRARKIG